MSFNHTEYHSTKFVVNNTRKVSKSYNIHISHISWMLFLSKYKAECVIMICPPTARCNAKSDLPLYCIWYGRDQVQGNGGCHKLQSWRLWWRLWRRCKTCFIFIIKSTVWFSPSYVCIHKHRTRWRSFFFEKW